MRKVLLTLLFGLLVLGAGAVWAADCVEVDIEMPAQVIAEPGSFATGYFEVVNCGDEDATVELSVTVEITGFPPFDVGTIPVPMGAGEVLSREFHVVVPPNAAGNSVTICMTATSGTAEASDCGTTEIIGGGSVAADGSKTVGVTIASANANECVEVDLELPDTVDVTAGDYFDGYFELTNCGDEAATILMDVSLQTPDTTVTLTAIPVDLGAGETISKEFHFPIPAFVPAGEYGMCITATSGSAVSTVCQTVVVLNDNGGNNGVPFDACGVLVQGTDCVLFAVAGQPDFLLSLDNYGDFQVGDTVCVSGLFYTDCVTNCTGASGCVVNNSIYTWQQSGIDVSNYPNPFNPSTTINLNLPTTSRVTIDIYNVLGAKVRVLQDGVLSAGNHSIEWDGTDNNGRELSSGIYFYRVQAGNDIVTQKMLLVK